MELKPVDLSQVGQYKINVYKTGNIRINKSLTLAMKLSAGEKINILEDDHKNVYVSKIENSGSGFKVRRQTNLDAMFFNSIKLAQYLVQKAGKTLRDCPVSFSCIEVNNNFKINF